MRKLDLMKVQVLEYFQRKEQSGKSREVIPKKDLVDMFAVLFKLPQGKAFVIDEILAAIKEL